jgi:kinetochor protein Mis14/NSL1
MPKRAVDGVKKYYRDGLDEDDEALREVLAQMQQAEEADKGIEMGDLDEEGFIQGTWGNGIAGLERVKRTLPETVAKKERAERAENYANGQGERI